MERKINGREITDEQIQAWADEAEAGYDAEFLRTRIGRAPRGSAASEVVPVRLTPDELAALNAKAAREGLNRSEAIRAALDAWVGVA